MTLHPQPAGIADVGCPGFVCRPQNSWTFHAAPLLDHTPRGSRDAGLVLRQNEDYSLQLLLTAGDGGGVVRVIRRFGGVDRSEAERAAPDGPMEQSVDGRDLDYTFAVNDVEIVTVDGRALSTTVAGDFTGTMLGLDVHSSDHDATAPPARWSWFDYQSVG